MRILDVAVAPRRGRGVWFRHCLEADISCSPIVGRNAQMKLPMVDAKREQTVGAAATTNQIVYWMAIHHAHLPIAFAMPHDAPAPTAKSAVAATP